MVGFTSAAAYMFICALYSIFTAGSPLAPFLCIGTLSSGLAYQSWSAANFSEDDAATARIFAQSMFGATCLAGLVMKMRNTEERKRFNRRFVKINEYCEQNPDFTWVPGRSAPEGFKDD